MNHLNHHGFIADAARLVLLHQGPKKSAPGAEVTRLPATGGSSVILADRVRQANEEGIITDGQARAALQLSAGDPLPWS